MEAKNLNVKQKQFCNLYASNREFFGNGVESYVEAYKIDKSKTDWYKSACSCASRLLRNVRVISYINELLQEEGLNDAFVDKQLKFLITQFSDLSIKLNAIREYNKLRNRITQKQEIDSKTQVIQLVSYHDAIKENI